MRSATALSLLAVGAIFAFAVHGHPRFLNFQVLGWVLILTAIAGLVLPRRGRGWLRRTVLVKQGKGAARTRGASGSEPPPAAPEPKPAGDQVESESIVEFTEK
jgi:hypothetical protein